MALTAAGVGCSTPRPIVLVASSLAELEPALNGIGFDVSVGGTVALASQVRAGAPVAAMIAADDQTLDSLAPRSGAVTIAHNRLAFAWLAPRPRPAIETAGLCEASVPCGRYARAWLKRNGHSFEPAIVEPDVGALVARILAGEVESGIVYESSLGGALTGDVLSGDRLPVQAAAFTAEGERALQFLTSAPGRQAIRRAGLEVDP